MDDLHTHAEGPSTDLAKPRHARTAKRIAILTLVVILSAGSIYLYRVRTLPQPPAVPLAGLDPAIIEVLEQCYDSVHRHPRSGAAWGKLGTALLAYEFKSEAQACFREAEIRDPSNPRWPYFHGLSLFPDATDEGLNNLRRATELNGKSNSAARNRLGMILSELGQYDEAETHFKSVLQQWPDDPAAILGLGKLAYAGGRLEDSVTFLNQAASNRHTAKAARQLLATVHQRLGNTDAAAQVTREMAELPEDEPIRDPFVDEASVVRAGRNAWLDHATQLLRQGKIAEAQPLVLRTVQVYPESADAWILLARIQMTQGDYRAAKGSWEKALDRAPRAVEALVELGVTQLHLSDPTAAVDCFRRAIELKPNLSEAHYNLGLGLTATRQTDEATNAFREAIRLRPGFVDSYLGLADSLARSGNMDEARRTIDQALELVPTDTRAIERAEQYRAESKD